MTILQLNVVSGNCVWPIILKALFCSVSDHFCSIQYYCVMTHCMSILCVRLSLYLLLWFRRLPTEKTALACSALFEAYPTTNPAEGSSVKAVFRRQFMVTPVSTCGMTPCWRMNAKAARCCAAALSASALFAFFRPALLRVSSTGILVLLGDSGWLAFTGL